MHRTYLGLVSKSQHSLLARISLVVIGVVAFFPSANPRANQPPAKPKADFAGKWDGYYDDNERNFGAGKYELFEGPDGRLTGAVTWAKGTKKMDLKGERLGHNTMRMQGEFCGTTYRYIGGMAGDELKLHYESEDKDGTIGFGLSRLTRPINNDNGIYYLELTGMPAKMGIDHGKALKPLIRHQVKLYRKNVIDTFGEANGKKILDYVVNKSKFVDDVKEILPHVYEELEGIAKGSGEKLDDILLLQMYEEVYEGAAKDLNIKPLKKPEGKCTTLTCIGQEGAPNLNAQNLDLTPNLDGAQLMIRYTYPKSGLQILLYTFAGQVGGIGANNKGLSMVCNTLPEGSKLKNRGLGGVYTTRALLEQGSIDAAVKWLDGKPQYGAYNYSLTDMQGSLMVEYSPKGLARLEVPKKLQFLAHTNHILSLVKDRNVIDDYPDGLPNATASGYTKKRLEAANRLLTEHSAKGRNVTVDDLKKILTAAPINNHAEHWVTLQSIIVVHDRKGLLVYASAGDAPKRSWNSYAFKKTR